MTEMETRLQQGLQVSPDQAAHAAQRFVAAAGDLADIAYTTTDTPIGTLLVAATHEGLLRVAFENENKVLEALAERISPRILEVPARLDGIRRELDEYFGGRRAHFDLALDWSLITGFRVPVLQATARIPYGKTATYGAIAREAGRPKGAQATGQALGANPIPIVIPCHRVVQAGGRLGGYAGGTNRKELLLRLEGALL